MEVWTAPEVAEIFTKKKQDGMVVILKALAFKKEIDISQSIIMPQKVAFMDWKILLKN